MSTFAVSMVKDECDVIEGTLRHLAEEAVDAIIVADNGSTDGTREILDELTRDLPLTVLDDPDIAYYQSHKMTFLARMAGERAERSGARDGETWIIPFDADEIWVFRGEHIATELANCRQDVHIVTAELFNHFPSAVDPEGKDPFETIVWRQPHPAPLPKVAFRWHPEAYVHQGNHGVDLPGGATIPGLVVHHFPYRSPEQFVRKARNGAAAYRATDLPFEVGQHWRQYGDLLDAHGPEVLHDVYRQYFWHLAPADAGLTYSPAPYRRWPHR